MLHLSVFVCSISLSIYLLRILPIYHGTKAKWLNVSMLRLIPVKKIKQFAITEDQAKVGFDDKYHDVTYLRSPLISLSLNVYHLFTSFYI